MPPEGTAANLFGTTRKLAAAGGHEPDQAKLSVPLADPEAVARLFCRGCGQITKVSQQGVNGLAQDFHLVLPESLADRYFLAGRCLFCAESFQSVSVQTI